MSAKIALVRAVRRQGLGTASRRQLASGVLGRRRCTLTSSRRSSSSSNAAASFHEEKLQPEEKQRRHLYEAKPAFRRDPVVPYPQSAKRTVPNHISFPPYAKTGHVQVSGFPEQIYIHDAASIKRMTKAARLARKVLDMACAWAVPGVTTDSIDKAVHDAIIKEGAYPSPLNYHGFPKSLCSSINEVICHGIPDVRPLEMGDVVSFDVSCYLNGVHGDNCATVIVGDSSASCNESAGRDWRGLPYKTDFDSKEQQKHFEKARQLVQATRESLYAAIETCKPGGCLTNIGAAIHDVADSFGFDTVQKYRGHGISHEFHCMPYVKHYRNNDALKLMPGMIFTIEPMLTEGSSECTEWDDDWTVVTVDGGLAAQFEHTVLITDSGVEILTQSEEQ